MDDSLIGKFGENPTRTRHCNADIYFISHWFKNREGEKMVEAKSGDLP
jgi:hypothetical protein